MFNVLMKKISSGPLCGRGIIPLAVHFQVVTAQWGEVNKNKEKRGNDKHSGLQTVQDTLRDSDK
jgi:hypothetical protein